jgi:hypothetical protein
MDKIEIDHAIVKEAIAELRSFYLSLQNLFLEIGIDLRENPGRRNMILSLAQEKIFADKINSLIPGTSSNGKAGSPDILVGNARSIECKITSQCPGGSVNLQTDYRSLQKKVVQDYLYVIVNPAFDKCAVLFYSSLTAQDFRRPSASSRDKTTLVKSRCMDRCQILMGNVVSLRDAEIQKLEKQKEQIFSDSTRKRCERVISMIGSSVGSKSFEKQRNLLKNDYGKFRKKILEIEKRIKKWQSSKDRYRIELMSL